MSSVNSQPSTVNGSSLAPFEFRVEGTDGQARAGRLALPHGEVLTPAFMPVGTWGHGRHLSLSELGASAKLVLANPVVVSTEGDAVQEEGCLSLPDFRANTTRPERVTVRFQDIGGTEVTRTGQGLLARAFCHEIDHLNGILFIHHLSALKRDSIKRKVRRMMRAGEW